MNIGFFSAVIFTQKGGIERFASHPSAWLSERGHRCFIYGLRPGNGVPQYPIAQGVQTRALMEKNQPSFKTLRERIINDDLDVFCIAATSATRLMLLQILNNLNIPIIMSERSSPAAVEALYLKRRERLATFFGAEVIHLLSEKYLDSVPIFCRNGFRLSPIPARRLFPLTGNSVAGRARPFLLLAALERSKKIDSPYQCVRKVGATFP